MPSAKEILRSSIGKKLVNGLTGLLLCGFIVAHLIGNLLLLVGRDAFNEYAHFLHTFGHGFVVPVAEVGLVLLFGVHAIAGVQVARDRRRARPQRYSKRADAGGRSRKSLASSSMIITGVVLLIFVIGHVAMFRFGVGAMREYAPVMIDGHESQDLYALVVDWFKVLPVTGAYVAVMLLLGMHLRHGFWSAFQTLGANNPKYMPMIYGTGIAFAVIMAVGFLALPVYLYLFADPVAGGAMTAG